MILPMVCVCSWSDGLRVLRSVSGEVLVRTVDLGACRVGVVSAGDGHEGRSQHAIAQSIPAADLLDDLALRPACAGHVGDRLVLARVERRPGLGRRSRSRPRSRAALAACGRSPPRPRTRRRLAMESGRASMARSKSSATASTLRMRSSPARPRSRSRSSAVRRLKLRNSARSRCSATRYSSACRFESSSSPRQRLDVGEQLGRPDIHLVGALIRAGALRSLGHGSAFRHRDGPPVRP